jgi:hypothetical protein
MVSKMSNLHLENTIYQLLCRYLPHNHRQLRRLAAVCSAVQLAKSTHLSHIARWVGQPTQQTSRTRFVSRFFMSALFSDSTIYQLLFQQAVQTYREPVWHVVIDRSNWIPKQQDLLMVSLSYHKRAIPIAWQIHDFGPTNVQEQVDLLERVHAILPKNQPIILHGDAEFGSVPLMRFITRQTHWQFILGQRSRTQFHLGDWQWQAVHELKITPSHPFYASSIFWTKSHNFGPLNFFAFHKPYRSGRNEPQKLVRYCTTSLPIAPHLRRLGHRRWGCEPMFRDFKSSGWNIQQSGLPDIHSRHALLLILSINYLWAISLGRWLCKVGRRHEVDTKKNGILAYFVLVGIGLFISIRCTNQSPHF